MLQTHNTFKYSNACKLKFSLTKWKKNVKNGGQKRTNTIVKQLSSNVNYFTISKIGPPQNCKDMM